VWAYNAGELWDGVLSNDLSSVYESSGYP